VINAEFLAFAHLLATSLYRTGKRVAFFFQRWADFCYAICSDIWSFCALLRGLEYVKENIQTFNSEAYITIICFVRNNAHLQIFEWFRSCFSLRTIRSNGYGFSCSIISCRIYLLLGINQSSPSPNFVLFYGRWPSISLSTLLCNFHRINH
jgi:hypothetical protein